MKELDIVFTKSKKKFPIASWAIMWWTNKEFSHVAKGSEVREWGTRYFQSSEGKVNYEYEKFFLKKHKIMKRYKLLISDELDMKIREACYKESGNTYGVMQNIGIALTDIYYWIFKKNIENPWKKGRVCSEILYTTCFKIMIPELNYDENKIKPHEIEDIILQYFVQEGDYWVLKS